jgi:alkylated DNA repair protein (DNA oxidative demethylase)
MSLDLLEQLEQHQQLQDTLVEDAVLLRRFALADAPNILTVLDTLLAQAPLRHMQTPGGKPISVAMSNCGNYGWVSDHLGYRYSDINPQTQQPWPTMPDLFCTLAQRAATQAGFENFMPDVCLINRYVLGTRMSLHQDKDESDFNQPIVSMSLGMPATFLFGGLARTDKAQRIPLLHGDVLVWGGSARLRYHGVLPLKNNPHPLTGRARINLTFRKT